MAEALELDTNQLGVVGLDMYAGYLDRAATPEYKWPECYPKLNRLRRQDPEVGQWRVITGMLAAKVKLNWVYEKEQGNQEILDFLNGEFWDNLEGGQLKFLTTIIETVPLFGWSLFENVSTRLESGYNSFEKIELRDHSSFERWNVNDATDEILGMYQRTPDGKETMIPLDRATHLVFGDSVSPEGLGLLETIGALEEYENNLSIIFGIGSEHSAGYMKFKSTKAKLSAEDERHVQRAASAALTANANSFIFLPAHLDASLEHTAFHVGDTVLEGVKHYGIRKQQALLIQWLSLSTTSNTGSNAAMMTSTGIFLTSFNNMMLRFARSAGYQIYNQLARNNSWIQDEKPTLISTEIEDVNLVELGWFMRAASQVIPLGEQDERKIREKAGFLPLEPSSEEELLPVSQNVQNSVDEGKVNISTPSIGQGEDLGTTTATGEGLGIVEI